VADKNKNNYIEMEEFVSYMVNKMKLKEEEKEEEESEESDDEPVRKKKPVKKGDRKTPEKEKPKAAPRPAKKKEEKEPAKKGERKKKEEKPKPAVRVALPPVVAAKGIFFACKNLVAYFFSAENEEDKAARENKGILKRGLSITDFYTPFAGYI
jgi:hypothetical protein